MRPNESFIGQPVRSLQTMLRLIAEDDNRLPTVVPDGIYGSSTMNAVINFQQLHGIPITGIADQNTWNKIASAYELSRIRIEKAAPIEVLLEPGQIIKYGESNPYLFLLQGMLSFLSTSNDSIPMPSTTGILDEKTAASIAAFQEIAALEPSGELDRITWYYLVNLFTLEVHKENSQ